MEPGFSLFPEQASTFAGPVDTVYFAIVLVSVFFSALTAILLFFFAIKYRRRSNDEFPQPTIGSSRLEVSWVCFLIVVFLSMFFWSAQVYLAMARPPDHALEIYVVGRQWMWKVQHLEGQREINELHVPLGRPIKLVMTSEDVIHSFYVPAFRLKQDVLPGRYTSLWFQATKPGRYRLFCAEYCGTDHSRMGGWVTVMEPAEYEAWLTGATAPATTRPAGTVERVPADDWLLGGRADLSMATRGRQLFLKHQCIACHSADARARAPVLEELAGATVPLQDGRRAIADDDYLRESIRLPRAKVVAGYQPIMPDYPPDQLDESELQQLLTFIKSLKRGQTPRRNEETPPPVRKDDR
ncbi:MAG: cytochrome c oxidase subunit II [Gemmataceae bacterium]|nr:cytochrome c oxidase subunit II [Gemmataceae bacterium]